jgi:hypothetical protein
MNPIVGKDEGPHEEEVASELQYTHEHLNEMVLSDLRVICCHKKLPVSGTKAVLVERILMSKRLGVS